MFTYNITFVVAPEKEKEVLEYLRQEIIPELFNTETSATRPRLKKLVEAGGEKPEADHGLSIALSACLPSEEKAHHWHDMVLIPSLNDFHSKFGQHSLFFITLLQNLSL